MIPVNGKTGQLYPPQEKIPEFLSEFAKYAKLPQDIFSL
jgi:hypothetical protein